MDKLLLRLNSNLSENWSRKVQASLSKIILLFEIENNFRMI